MVLGKENVVMNCSFRTTPNPGISRIEDRGNRMSTWCPRIQAIDSAVLWSPSDCAGHAGPRRGTLANPPDTGTISLLCKHIKRAFHRDFSPVTTVDGACSASGQNISMGSISMDHLTRRLWGAVSTCLTQRASNRCNDFRSRLCTRS